MKHKNDFKLYGNTVVYFLWDKYSQQYIKGVSVCSPEDTFDLNYGIELARQKAIFKLHSRYAQVYKEQLELIDQFKASEENVKKQYRYWEAKTKKSQYVLDKLKNEH